MCLRTDVFPRDSEGNPFFMVAQINCEQLPEITSILRKGCYNFGLLMVTTSLGWIYKILVVMRVSVFSIFLNLPMDFLWTR